MDALKANAAAGKPAEIAAALQESKKLYGYAGALDWDAAKSLIARRERGTRALEDRLAALGPGGAALLGVACAQAEGTREKLLIIHALGRIQDDQAVGVLQALFAGESAYSLQRELVVALGHRKDSPAADALGGILAGQPDPQLRFAAAQGLGGREGALDLMIQRLPVEASLPVQQELVLSIGAVDSAAAGRALADVAQGALPPAVREAAIQELGRRFGAQALEVLDRSSRDPNEAIRQNTVAAVARVQGEPADALLARIAASDSSEAVRESAKTALSARP